MKKLYYLANLRLPTDKAHSVQIMKMCEAFASQGVDVELVIPNKRNNVGEADIFAYYGVKTHFKVRRVGSTDFLGKTRSFGKLFYWLDLLTFLFNLCFFSNFEKGSVFYTRDPKLLLPFNKRNYRRVVEIHSLPARRGFFLKLLRSVSRIVVVTKHLKEMLVKEGFSAETIMVAPDAVDIESFNINLSKREARESLSFPQDKTLIGYAGMLKTMGMEKGIDTALEALKGLADSVLVLIGGHPSDVDFYRGMAVKLGIEERVIFTGRVPYSSVPLHLKACDILIAPFPETEHYKYFMSPLKLFEYMASGVPIVVSDLPSIREIVDESMVKLSSPGNSEDLTRAIKEVLSDPEAASRRVEKTLKIVEDYSWQKRAENIARFV